MRSSAILSEHYLQKVWASAGITSLFVSTVLIPASSGFDHTSAQKDTAHFPRIRDDTGVAYDKMLFFDDERKNVARVCWPSSGPPCFAHVTMYLGNLLDRA